MNILFVLIYTVLPFLYVTPQPKLEPLELRNEIEKGIDFILKQEYERADTVFKSLQKKYPEHPAGYLYSLAVEQSKAIDYEELVDEKKFNETLEKIRPLCKKMCLSQPTSPWGYFFLGTLEGYDSFSRIQRSDWVGGIRKAMASTTEFEKVIAIDSSFYDAYVGPGTYYYWKSRKMNFLLWLPFISDDRELGIRMLRTSVQKGNFNKFAAYSALIAILIDAERYEEARILASEALQFYPNNRVFLWGLSSTLRRWGRKEEAIVAYTALLNAILSDSHPNLFNELACRSDILHLKIALKDFEGIEEQINKILSFENKYFLPHLQQRALKHFRAARELKSYTLKKN